MVQVCRNGDLKIDIRENTWTFNPRSVSRLEGDGVPLTPGTSGKSFPVPKGLYGVLNFSYIVLPCRGRVSVAAAHV